MVRGRKPLSPSAKALNGNPGKRPIPSTPQPEAKAPPCPPWLSPHAKAKWDELAPELLRLGLLTAADGESFACLCQAWSEFREATETLEEEGRYISRGTGALASHPAIQQQRTAWKAFLSFSALFGLDPTSRNRLGTVDPGADDPLGDFINGQ